MLIPIPRSAPLRQGALWPGREICEALVRAGLGADVAPVLIRSHAVQKSAFAAAGQRATPQDHFESMEVDSAFPPSIEKLTLVDDIVTRGATFIGSYPHIAQAFPSHPISCFALIRTMSGGKVATFVDPVRGTIEHRGNYLHREP